MPNPVHNFIKLENAVIPKIMIISDLLFVGFGKLHNMFPSNNSVEKAG